MSRSNLIIRLSLGLVLVLSASLSHAQQTQDAEMSGVMTPETKMSTYNDEHLLDVNVIGVNDPPQVDMLFREGDSILGILKEFNSKGFHIQFREKQFTEEMVLLNIPTTIGIDNVLREILEPWHFKIYRTPFGKVVVTPLKYEKKKKDSEKSEASAQEVKQDG